MQQRAAHSSAAPRSSATRPGAAQHRLPGQQSGSDHRLGRGRRSWPAYPRLRSRRLVSRGDRATGRRDRGTGASHTTSLRRLRLGRPTGGDRRDRSAVSPRDRVEYRDAKAWSCAHLHRPGQLDGIERAVAQVGAVASTGAPESASPFGANATTQAAGVTMESSIPTTSRRVIYLHLAHAAGATCTLPGPVRRALVVDRGSAPVVVDEGVLRLSRSMLRSLLGQPRGKCGRCGSIRSSPARAPRPTHQRLVSTARGDRGGCRERYARLSRAVSSQPPLFDDAVLEQLLFALEPRGRRALPSIPRISSLNDSLPGAFAR